MDIANTLNLLAAKLQTCDPAPARVYANPAEAVSLGDFPCIVLGLAPNQENSWNMESLGQGRNDYTVAMWVFVGSRQTGLQELYGRILPWPKAIADVLVADMTLGGQVAFIGDAQNSNNFFKYSPKIIPWGDGNYFGLEILLPVTERGVQTMG